MSDSEDGGVPSGAELQAYRTDNFAFADGRKISEIEHLKVIDMYQFKHITSQYLLICINRFHWQKSLTTIGSSSGECNVPTYRCLQDIVTSKFE